MLPGLISFVRSLCSCASFLWFVQEKLLAQQLRNKECFAKNGWVDGQRPTLVTVMIPCHNYNIIVN